MTNTSRPSEPFRRFRFPATVLVVDDCKTIRLFHAAVLRRIGFDVVLAEHGLDALAVLTNRKIDGLVLDLWMPQMDGLTLLRHVRTQLSLVTIPVVVVTSDDDCAKRSELEGLGAALVKKATKPLSLATVFASVLGETADN